MTEFPQKHLERYYPVAILPDLIRAHLFPQTSVPVGKSPQIAKPTLKYTKSIDRYRNLAAIFVAIAAGRLLNLYTNNALAIGCFLLMAGCLLLMFGEMGTQERRFLARQQAVVGADREPGFNLPNWQAILAERVLQPSGIAGDNVSRGVCETEFLGYLQKYFPNLLAPSYSFVIPNTDLKYSADFCLVLTSGLSLCVEIDEPYVGKTGRPHHCIDDDRDARRDKFFTDGNWIVIRFSEKQVVTQPDACCLTIAKVIHKLTGDASVLTKFSPSIQLPTPDRCWTVKEAEEMASQNYRQTYG